MTAKAPPSKRMRIDATLRAGKAAGYEHACVEYLTDGTVRVEFGPPPAKEAKRARGDELERKMQGALNGPP